MSAIFQQAVDQWAEVRAEWLQAVEALYLEAERVTRGHLLNRRGREAGVDARTLFYGNESRAKAYASDELLEFWRGRGRLPYREFEARALAEREDAYWRGEFAHDPHPADTTRKAV